MYRGGMMEINVGKCFFAISILTMILFFLFGLFTYGFFLRLMPGEFFYSEIGEHWRLSLINAGLFAFSSLFFLIYLWLKGFPFSNRGISVFLVLKASATAVLVYISGFGIVWLWHFLALSREPSLVELAMVPVSELKVHWAAMFSSVFWFLLALKAKHLGGEIN